MLDVASLQLSAITITRKRSAGQSSRRRFATVRAMTASSSCAGTKTSKRKRREERCGGRARADNIVDAKRETQGRAAGRGGGGGSKIKNNDTWDYANSREWQPPKTHKLAPVFERRVKHR